MKALRQQIGLMAPTNGRVLIYGESGTGKELVAHAIHGQSLRKDETFVEVNCAAIPEDLIESELFGHYRGSFPGAAADKEGKFQRANGGTLFLDEVGDMSLKTQSKVLRTLEEQRFTSVGSNETINSPGGLPHCWAQTAWADYAYLNSTPTMLRPDAIPSTDSEMRICGGEWTKNREAVAARMPRRTTCGPSSSQPPCCRATSYQQSGWRTPTGLMNSREIALVRALEERTDLL